MHNKQGDTDELEDHLFNQLPYIISKLEMMADTEGIVKYWKEVLSEYDNNIWQTLTINERIERLKNMTIAVVRGQVTMYLGMKGLITREEEDSFTSALGDYRQNLERMKT